MFRAPAAYVERMRRVVGDRRLCVHWVPNGIQRNPDGSPNGFRGCWAVTRNVRVPRMVTYGGVNILYAPKARMPFPGSLLDGDKGVPRHLGQWLISGLIRSDQNRRGWDRMMEMQKWADENKRAARRSEMSLLDDQAMDPDLARGCRNITDQVGRPQVSREDLIANRQKMEMAAAAAEQQFEDELTEDRFV